MSVTQFAEKDNCGVGVVVSQNGIPQHDILLKGIAALIKLFHRGAIQSDGRTGDGCGILVQIPHEFFQSLLNDENEFQLAQLYAVGNIFFSPQPSSNLQRKIINEECKKLGFENIFFRQIPVNPSVLGSIAINSLPYIEQLFINAPEKVNQIEFELQLFILRKNIEYRLRENDGFFICSLSSSTIVYKALCLPQILKEFYLDLTDPLFKTSICVFHQRFSTNTQPSWHLAQPFRYLAHNGEINTVSSNRLWAKERSIKLLPAHIQEKLLSFDNLVNSFGSDSFSLDNMLEILLILGVDYKQALRTLIPPYHNQNNKLSPDVAKWYETAEIGFEPWDGPAGIVFTNGKQVMCCLDRNGLRPLRYLVTHDGLVVAASETGVIDCNTDEVVLKNRLGAGEMLVIDTAEKTIFFDQDIYPKFDLSLINDNHYIEQTLSKPDQAEELYATLDVYKKLFLITREELEQTLYVLSTLSNEPTMSMGDDAAIAVMSKSIRPITDYLRQNFAQVTNPAIDSIREKYVMSLTSYIGDRPNLIRHHDLHGYKLTSPVLDEGQFYSLINSKETWLNIAKIELSYNPDAINLEQAIKKVVSNAIEHIKNGVNLLIISDKHITPDMLIIPSPMAVGAIHNQLIDKQLRLNVDLVVETAYARDPHQFCVLLGFGATAVYPYLSYQIISSLTKTNDVDKPSIKNYISAINKGILKIMSKMGISTINSYRGSQLFEALGLAKEVSDLCFSAAVSRIEGATFASIEAELKQANNLAWNDNTIVEIGSSIKYAYFGEYHAFNPDVVTRLQVYVRSGKLEDYYAFADTVNKRSPMCLRDLFRPKIKLNQSFEPIDDMQIEPFYSICARFDTAAMSIGALGREAHEALAMAMNSINGKSNSGEGGEDPRRYGTTKNSKIKQIASGRFGVTPAYLMSAEIIQIKIAQGAKPGEGGQLPGEKVTVEIAKLRHATPGVTLISPPPHHDIYSIEDLAQLIFDLKQLNPGALISVKLVAEAGIGVIACGVAKAKADLITISGYDGGTGAAPVTSIKNAGTPWELGLSETHAALVSNNLRHKIRLQVDGGLKTGLDVIKAAILGAESFGFGTAPMVALGCKYLRICHLNTCATGIATQDEKLRSEHFSGLPEMVVNYFRGVVHEVQQWLIAFGVRKITDLIGRLDLLELIENPNGKKLDLSVIRDMAGVTSIYPLFHSEANTSHDRGVLNQRIAADCMDSIYTMEALEKHYPIYNTDRAVGATVAGEIAKAHGVSGVSNPITLRFEGIAGQSFGTWATVGMNLYLHGEANDYVAKGLAGGKIVIRHNNPNIVGSVTVMGNTCLYGATSGTLFANGNAGDRFAARNSGVIAVIEGVASNGCEYMTGGVVMILGDIDQNFGAGMTGGVCYIWNQGDISTNLNNDFVEVITLDDLNKTKAAHILHIEHLVQSHYQETSSARAADFIANMEENIRDVKIIKPKGTSAEDLVKFWIKPV